MKKTDLKRHLQDYSIFNKRKTTINHAFASSLSVCDDFNEANVDKALLILGQLPDADLQCAYCDKLAETWDHIHALVKNGDFSGYGQQINNLIPCCKDCNSKKGNKNWEVFLKENNLHTIKRMERIKKYISQNNQNIPELLKNNCAVELEELDFIKQQIFELMKIGDEKAISIRNKIRSIQAQQ